MSALTKEASSDVSTLALNSSNACKAGSGVTEDTKGRWVSISCP